MNRVAIGQTWSQNNFFVGGLRSRFKIVAVDEGLGIATVRFEGRHPHLGPKKLSTLRLGRAGARIELEADGRPPEFPPPLHGCQVLSGNERERSTASDHRKIIAPRGMTAAERKAWIRRSQRMDKRIVNDR